ncbi:WD40-repeat-containing domain protein [Flagelloscypha sp. PMI_526]|nr:WD40-repeat-containing domain protein [Flagelloscypha sp. PMI_526]
MVSSVAYSPDGSQIASGSSDATIRIWDTATHQPVGEPLRSHRGSIFSVAFSPDGSQIVSGSWDHTIRIWDIATRQSIGDAHKIFKTIVFPHASHALTPNLLLSDDGWLIDPEKYRVVWIPHHLHEFLPRPNLVDIIGARGIIEVDMSDMRVGTEWPSCIEAGQ